MKRPGLAFLVVVLLSILLAPLAARAQPGGKTYRIGTIFNNPPMPMISSTPRSIPRTGPWRRGCASTVTSWGRT
jgi:hypothetical protein